MENGSLVPIQDTKESPYFVYFEYGALPFKCLSKVFKANFITVTMMIDEIGIFVQENTSNGSIVFETLLHAQKFDKYLIPVFAEEKSVICLGFNSIDFMQQLDSAVKTDTLRMYVLASNTNVLHMEIVKKGDGGISHRFIALCKTDIGNFVSPNYNEHKPTIKIDGTRFAQVGTAASKQSKHNVRIRAQEHALVVEGISSGIKGFKEILGDWVEGRPVVFDEIISTSRFASFNWMGKVTKKILIYACPGRPLKLSADVCSLGTCSLYLQTEGQELPPQEAFQHKQLGY